MRAIQLHFPLLLPTVVLLLGCKTASTPAVPHAATSAGREASDPAGQKMDEWLAAINSADRARLERVHAGPWNAKQRASMDMMLAERSGGFDVRHIVASTPTERLALVQGRKTGRWRCLALAVQPDPPHGIEMILLPPAEAPTDAQGGAQLAPYDDKLRRDVIDALVRELNRAYILPEKAVAMESELRAKQQRHAYDALGGRLAFSIALTEDLQRVSHDRHLRLEVGCSSAPPPPSPSSGGPPPGPPVAGPRPPLGGPGPGPQIFGETRRLDGNVAYVEIATFGAEGEAVREEIRQTMSAVADATAIIFDLRRNGGGDAEPVTLVMSYLFGNDAVQRSSLYSRLTNRTEDRFTDPQVPGTKFGSEKPVYVLTSGHTFSAAEAFAYDLQALKRAVVVGETTGGGAHAGDMFTLPHGFSAFVPYGRAINPITKSDWEGGVKPDVAVSAEKALETAHKLALERVKADGKALPEPKRR